MSQGFKRGCKVKDWQPRISVFVAYLMIPSYNTKVTCTTRVLWVTYWNFVMFCTWDQNICFALCLNGNKTKILVSNTEHNKILVSNPRYPCGVCTFSVGANSLLCTSCDLWVHNKSSRKTDHFTDNRNFACYKCSGEIVPAAIAFFKKH